MLQMFTCYIRTHGAFNVFTHAVSALVVQGHFYEVSTLSFSPDGTYLASGSDDAKVKVWSVASGYCFVTFAEHRAAVTGLAWTPPGNAVLSCSLDGTVRAFDLVRCAAKLQQLCRNCGRQEEMMGCSSASCMRASTCACKRLFATVLSEMLRISFSTRAGS